LKRSAIGVLFLTVFIDLLGFGIVLPLLPRYADMFNASPREIGILLASFSAMQFLFSPLWGRLSDRYGRRPLLMLGLAGSCVSYVIFAFATTWTVLLVSRMLAGIFAATIGTAQAYIADVTGKENRGKEMALIGAAFGIGFTMGPTIGWLAHDFIGQEWPGLVAAAFSFVAFLLAWKKLPEPERHVERRPRMLFDATGWKHAMSTPGVPLILLLQIVAVFCFANFEGTLAIVTKDKWGKGIQGNGLLYTYVGFCLLVAQGFLVRRFMPRVGERAFAQFGCLLLGAGLLGIAVGGSSMAIVLPVLAVAALGFAMISPSLSSLLSLHTPHDIQGSVLGIGQSGLALARILGPYVGFELLGRSVDLPYWVGAGIMGAAFVAALMLKSAPAR